MIYIPTACYCNQDQPEQTTAAVRVQRENSGGLVGGADLQVMVLAVGVDLIAGVHVEHRVQTLGGTGVLFKLLHLTDADREEV